MLFRSPHPHPHPHPYTSPYAYACSNAYANTHPCTRRLADAPASRSANPYTGAHQDTGIYFQAGIASRNEPWCKPDAAAYSDT